MTSGTAAQPVPTIRISPDNATVLANLGLLAELAGTWQGGGFNLVARPDFQDQSATFLELNLTSETLSFEPISSSIPNRGFKQPDIELFGLTYLQQISDATTGGALHIEPGIWINQPPTNVPPADPPLGGQLVARMANIPHGNSLLAQGFAVPFSGPPVISPGAQPISGGNPAFSSFPSFNSTPILLTAQPGSPVGSPNNPIFAAGNTEAQSKPGGGFSEYTLSNPPSPQNTRTPIGNLPPVLPPSITQQLVNDPITLLQQTIEQQIADGYQFEGVALNISTASPIAFNTQPVVLPTTPTSPTVTVDLPQFGGGIANLAFLEQNAETVLVYSTFWLEKLTHPDGRPVIMQLQYAQMTMLNFPVPASIIPAPTPDFSWPHITVSTLQRTFG